MPPVANSRTPARAAAKVVAETVVAPSAPRAHKGPRSARPALRHLSPPLARAIRSSVSPSMPTVTLPRTTATVAGTAPCRPTSKFSGQGMPCATSVDSSATTARRSASALRTSSLTAR